MPLSNMGYLIAVALKLASVSYSSYIVDTSGVNHPTKNSAITFNGTYAVAYTDTSSDSYQASELVVQINYNNTNYTVLTESLSVSKSSDEVLTIVVTFSLSPTDTLSSYILPALVIYLSGVSLESPFSSVSIVAPYTLVTYSTSGSSCTSTVSSTSSGSASLSSWSVNGNTLVLQFNISYGSCQQLQDIPVVQIQTNLTTATYQGTLTSSTVCSYGSSCSVTVTAEISV